MSLDFVPAESIIRDALGRVAPAMQVEVRVRGRRAISRAYGWLDPEQRQRPTRRDSLFDLASVTKLFVVTAFMTLVEEGAVGLDQPVSSVLPEFSGVRPIRPYEDPLKPGQFVEIAAAAGGAPAEVDASRVTFRNLLSHNSGLPAWRPLYKEGNPDAARRLALTTHFSYSPGERVVYSDIGLILLGMSVERLTGLGLGEAVRLRVAAPLGLANTSYVPKPSQLANIAPTEVCAWRQRRLVGEVHDENAAGLGGGAGHAGLFSTARDVAVLGQSFLDSLQALPGRVGQPGGASPQRRSPDAAGKRRQRYAMLDPDTMAQMVHLQAADGAVRRGLGFALWSPDTEASSNPLSRSAFGHLGFTGTSLWIDPDRSLVVVCLTNRVYYGRATAAITAFRVALHRAVVQAVDKGGGSLP